MLDEAGMGLGKGNLTNSMEPRYSEIRSLSAVAAWGSNSNLMC